MTSDPILVVGGGIGGLAAAIGLRRAGYTVTVYERAPELHELGAGLTLWDNAVRALGQLGLGDLIGSLAVPGLEGGIRSASGALLAGSARPGAPSLAGALSVVVHRAELHRALAEQLGPGQIRLGKALVGFSQDARGVTARFADGSSARASLLIGADGLRSQVRAQLHGDRPPRYSGYTAWRAVVPFDVRRVLPGETWGRGARFGQVPLNDGRVYWFATLSAPAGGRSPEGEQAALLRLFAGWHAPIEGLIRAAAPEEILRHDIYDRPPLRRWGRGRVTLLGDAAHPMTPNLGQGACQALEDAAVLARLLGGARDLPAALRQYEARRIPRTSAIVSRSRQIGAVAQWRHPLAARLRDALLRLVPPGAQARQISRLVEFAF